MNPDSMNKWLGVLANFGVLIGIAVVVIEINQNTTAIQTDTAWSRAQWVLDYNNPVSSDADLAELLFKFRKLSRDEFLELGKAPSSELYRVGMRINMDRIYQETRYLTRTSFEERRVQKNQMLRDCSPFRVVIMEQLGYDDLEPGFGLFLREIIEEMKRSPCMLFGTIID